MATYTTFRDIYKTSRISKDLFHVSKRVHFSVQSLDAGNGDVHEVLPVVPGEIVLASWIDVKEACPSFSSIDLGYGTVPNKWGNGLFIDSTGIKDNVLSTSFTWNFIALNKLGQLSEEIELAGVAHGDEVIITPSIPIEDLVMTGHVSSDRFNTVVVQLMNPAETKIDLGSMTVNIVVNKAPMAGMPWVVSEGDTIDIKATTDGMDVNIDSGVIEVNALIVRI